MDTTHLVALQTRLSHERAYFAADGSEIRKQTRIEHMAPETHGFVIENTVTGNRYNPRSGRFESRVFGNWKVYRRFANASRIAESLVRRGILSTAAPVPYKPAGPGTGS